MKFDGLGEFDGFLAHFCTIMAFASQIDDTRRWRGSSSSPKETGRNPFPTLHMTFVTWGPWDCHWVSCVIH